MGLMSDRPVWIYYFDGSGVSSVNATVLDYDDKGVTVKTLSGFGERWYFPNTSIQRIVLT